MQRIRGRRIAMILQDPMSSLNPVFSIGMQMREPVALYHGLRGRALTERAAALLASVRIPSPAAAPARVPPPALGRHAPAGGGRHGHRGAAAPAHRRRADHEPRPHDPGAVPGPAQGAAAAAPARHDLRHPQPRDRGEDLRPGGGDVRGAHRRDGAGAADLHARPRIRTPARCSSRSRGSARARSASPPSRASRPTSRGCPAAARSPRAARTSWTGAAWRRRPSAPVGDGPRDALLARDAAHERAARGRGPDQALPGAARAARPVHRAGARGGLDLVHDRGRDHPRAGGRVRLRQDHHVQAGPGPRAADRGRHPLRGRGRA